MRRLRLFLVLGGSLFGLAVPVPARGADPATAAAQTAATPLPPASPGQPSTTTWTGKVHYVPVDPVAKPLDGGAPCPLAEEGTVPECQEQRITIPPGAGALYVKVSWDRPDHSLYLYPIAPDRAGTPYGLDFSKLGPEFDKRPGNSTTLPFSEATVRAPVAGTWTIRVRAAWGFEVPYTAAATITTEEAVIWPREDPLRLARWAVHDLDVNIVLAGFTLTPDQIATVRSNLPDHYYLPVALKQSAFEFGRCPTRYNWGKCRFGGDGGPVPYFEPVRLNYRYHFLQADETFTRAAFAAMARLARRDQRYHAGTVPHQQTYLAHYNATRGVFRGAGAQVADPSRVDLIDAWGFEDWLFEQRLAGSCGDFTDLETGQVHGGGFIAPDPAARYDPFYDSGDVDRMPQGRNQGATIFFFDTFSPPYAAEYFRPGVYHNFSTFDHYVDPDTGAWGGIDFARLWGGRYRFAFFDLGAAPNHAESAGPQDGSRGGVGGSADGPEADPPIWEYRFNPRFAGLFESRGLARNVATLLFSRMTAGFVVRPIPHDVYQLAATTFSDHYSRPPFGSWWTDLSRVYQEDLAARWLSSAAPQATFIGTSQIPGFIPHRYLGCSDVRAGTNNYRTEGMQEPVMAPDPTCARKEADPLQRAVELAKAHGDDTVGTGVSAGQSVSMYVMRRFWEQHRALYAPVRAGVSTLVVINAIFEQGYAWYVPVAGAGFAVYTPTLEAWGVVQGHNDLRRQASAVDCSRSRPLAPGCPPVPSPPGVFFPMGFTYTVEHESSHALGVAHPHDFIGVDKDERGNWATYYNGLAWMADSTHSPSTYFALVFPFGVWDQDNLMRGHAGEYLQQAQDAIADAYFDAGRRGITDLRQAPDVIARRDRMTAYLEQGRAAFAAGDYLHAEYAFRNASLVAQGVDGPEVTPRRLAPGERPLFRIRIQDGPTRAESLHRCSGP